jgi:hypothetical protein
MRFLKKNRKAESTRPAKGPYFLDDPHAASGSETRVVVAEIEGELIAFVLHPHRPVVRIPIGEVDLSSLVPAGALKSVHA